MPSPSDVLRDPNFHQLPQGERLKVMRALDQNFAALPEPEQMKVVGGEVAAPAAAAPTPEQKEPSIGDSVTRFSSNFWDQVNPIPAIKAVGAAVYEDATGRNPGALDRFALQLGHNILKLQGDQFTKAKEMASQGRYSEAAGYAGAGLLPILGPAAAGAGEQIGEGDIAGGLGKALGAIASVAGPGAIARAAQKTAKAAQVAERGAATKLYQSALKPGVSDAEKLADVRGAVETGLTNEIPVSEAGATKLDALIKDYQQQVTQAVQNASSTGRRIRRADVSRRANDAIHDATLQANPTDDVRAALRTKQNFDKAHPAQMDPLYAQNIKIGTNARLQGKYGQMSEAAIETEKALVRGLKEELEAVAPELKGLNAKEGEFLQLQPALERAVRRAGNADVTDLGDAAIATSGAVVGAPVAAPVLFLRKVLSMPDIKSRLAISINRASQKTTKPLNVMQSQARAAAIIDQIGNRGETSE